MAKNKHPTGQPMGKKMALALQKRCNELEDCIVSQQKRIAELESAESNNALAYALKDKRYNDAMHYLQLNKPEILKLMKTHAKHGVLAAQGKLPAVNVKLVKGKRKPRVFPEVPEVPEADVSHAPSIASTMVTAVVTETTEVIPISPAPAPQGPTGPTGVYDAKRQSVETWDPVTRRFVVDGDTR